MNLNYVIYLLLAAFFSSCCTSSDGENTFSFLETSEGIEVLDGEDPVLFYQKTSKSPNGEFFLNNYIHPLYTLEGDTLTEEFPKDHLHHRGIFWAWHQIYIDTMSVGDSWIMENVTHEVVAAKTSIDNRSAQISANVSWKSSLYQDEKPFIDEHTTITVHKAKENYRMIDFEILLKALVPEVFLGGSDNKKGYGGFSARIKLSENTVFTSAEGQATPQILQVEAGPWMDFSTAFGDTEKQSGLTILCHTSTANYVAPWILRQQRSMQNIVFPGREKVKISMDKPTILRYRLIVHRGNAGSIDIAKLQSEYEKISY